MLQYKVKWLDPAETSWEPVANLQNCMEFVDAYEWSLAINIIGVRRLGLDTSYAVLFKDTSVVIHDANDVRTNWPNLLQPFLFNRIEWINRINAAQNEQVNENKTVTVMELDPPTTILGKFNSFCLQFRLC